MKGNVRQNSFEVALHHREKELRLELVHSQCLVPHQGFLQSSEMSVLLDCEVEVSLVSRAVVVVLGFLVVVVSWFVV